MKNFEINKISKILILLIMPVFFSACEINDLSDPNGPSLSAISQNATIGEIRNIAIGTENLMRDQIGFYYDVTSIIGREYYFFTNSDPRYTGELLGKGASTLDNAGFYGTRPYQGRYRVVRNAEILLTTLETTSEVISAEARNGYAGFAKTCQAYSLLLALNLQYQNGIRTDVKDPDNLGPFRSYADALGDVSTLLDDAFTSLQGAGTEFDFPLSSGFSGFDTPSTFGQLNRAIKARVELYRGNKGAALTALTSSFMNLAGSLNAGPSHFYSDLGTEIANPVFRTPDQSEATIAHPSFLTDILPGDNRAGKVTLRPSGTRTLDGLAGNYDVTIFTSFNSPIPIIRNEELILIYAEANIGTDNAEAVNALDIIRNAHGLGGYAGGLTDNEVTNEMLYNRRFSLFGEGHRWIDLRRFNLLNTLPIDRTDDDVWDQFPRPVNEVGVQGG
jgi:hypothetical protein